MPGVEWGGTCSLVEVERSFVRLSLKVERMVSVGDYFWYFAG